MAMQENISALIPAAQGGNREGFDSLISEEAGRIRALVASRLGAHIVLEVDLDDVYQETLLRAFKSIRSFEWRGEKLDAQVTWKEKNTLGRAKGGDATLRFRLRAAKLFSFEIR